MAAVCARPLQGHRALDHAIGADPENHGLSTIRLRPNAMPPWLAAFLISSCAPRLMLLEDEVYPHSTACLAGRNVNRP